MDLELVRDEGRKEGRKEMFYLTTHSIHFYLRLYGGVGHVVKDHSESQTGNPLLPLHGLLFLISSKSSFIGTGRKEMFYLTTHSTHFT